MTIVKYKLDALYKTLLQSYSDTPFISALIASCLATIGLVSDSSSTVIAASLISPIGIFIIQANILNILKEYKYNFKGRTHSPWYIPLLLVIIVTLIISYLTGKLIMTISHPITGLKLDDTWPTLQMQSLSDPLNAVYFIPIALLAGLLLPLLITNNNIAGFVGIGIACSMLVPLANIGLSLNFIYDPLHHSPDLINYKRNAVLTGFAIFIINVIMLLLPSKLMMNTILTKNNIFEKIERVFNF
jgi:uncharacterized membrane protein